MKLLVAIISSITLLSLTSLPVHAQTPSSCRPIFGGGPSCEQSGSLTIDKKIRNPINNQFLDHADFTTIRYAADREVIFQITVTNTGNRAIKDITVTDIFPQFVTYSKGTGEYNRTTNTLSYQIKNLEPKQTNVVTLEGKVASATTLSQAKTPLCVVNQVAVSQGRNLSSDTTQFCLGDEQIPQATTELAQTPPAPGNTQGRPPVFTSPRVAVAPNTGPESLALIGLIPAAITGWALRRKSMR